MMNSERSDDFHPWEKDGCTRADAGNGDMREIRRSILRKLAVRMEELSQAKRISRNQKVTRNRLRWMTGRC